MSSLENRLWLFSPLLPKSQDHGADPGTKLQTVRNSLISTVICFCYCTIRSQQLLLVNKKTNSKQLWDSRTMMQTLAAQRQGQWPTISMSISLCVLPEGHSWIIQTPDLIDLLIACVSWILTLSLPVTHTLEIYTSVLCLTSMTHTNAQATKFVDRGLLVMKRRVRLSCFKAMWATDRVTGCVLLAPHKWSHGESQGERTKHSRYVTSQICT